MKTAYIILLIALAVNALANILIKASAIRGKHEKILYLLLNPYWLVGVFSFGLALIFYTKALEHFELSFAYPIMTGGGFAIVVFFSWLIFHENLTLYKILGYIFIWTGIIFLARG